MFKILLDTVRNSSAADLLEFVSPSFFDVVPVGRSAFLMTKMMREVLQTMSSDKKLMLQKIIDDSQIPVTLETPKAPFSVQGDFKDKSRIKTEDEGLVVLRLYFALIFGTSECALDLRHQSFYVEKDRIIWQPAHVMHTWDRAFIEPMRDIYRGFYTNNREQFREGLKKLNLDSAEALFLTHFGEGDQTQVSFTMNGFRKSFHDIFVHCKAQKIRLHEDFLPLGILLGSLYENFSKLSVPLNVRKAYEETVR